MTKIASEYILDLSKNKTNKYSLLTHKNCSFSYCEPAYLLHSYRTYLTDRILNAICDHSHPQIPTAFFYSLLQRIYHNLPVLLPYSPYLRLWHIVIILIILYFLLYIGLLLGYGEQVRDDYLNYMHVVSFILISLLTVDMLITPMKAIYLYGHLTINKHVIHREYFKMGFTIDFLALVGLMVPYLHQGYPSNYTKLLFLLKIYSLYYLYLNLRNQLKVSNTFYISYCIARILIIFTFISHFLGIGFYIIDLVIYTNNSYGTNTPNLCWIYNSSAYPQMILNLYWVYQYLYTMYFSIATMCTIAYGDITPLNSAYTVYIILALVVYTLSFAYILEEIIDMLLYSQNTKFEYQQATHLIAKIVQDDMVRPYIAHELVLQLEQTYITYRYRNTYTYKTVISQLPNTLKWQVLHAAYRIFMNEISIYWQQSYHSVLLMQLMSNVQYQHIFRGTILYQEHEDYYYEYSEYHPSFHYEHMHHVYYCMTAVVSIGVGQLPNITLKDRQHIDRLLKTKMSFTKTGLIGRYSFLHGMPRTHWAVNNTQARFWTLSRSSLVEVLPTLPIIDRYILQLAKYMPISCEICTHNHNFKQCPYVTYQLDQKYLHELLINKNTMIKQVEYYNDHRCKTKTHVYAYYKALQYAFCSQYYPSSNSDNESSLAYYDIIQLHTHIPYLLTNDNNIFEYFYHGIDYYLYNPYYNPTNVFNKYSILQYQYYSFPSASSLNYHSSIPSLSDSHSFQPLRHRKST